MLYEASLETKDPYFAEYFANPEGWDPYDVRRTDEEAMLISEHADHAMRTPEHLETLLGVELTEIAGLAPPGREPSSRHFGAMRDEHLAVAKHLETIRDASDDFALPDWACGSYRALFGELQAIEQDIFQHVHLENHVLAPRFGA
ncbi:uncharacterized protein SOCEGT47_033550 [Sorangium cellulosum]|uniref:Uncharacterized protein n=1 Tax=Sorangium cellulosum TaxID=56 RepID=A0A4P2Q0W8_SORCE|nr:hemerythrin domain-containing protein [Sorangium cellulosum]AUX22839.1 uncharacterized protein SOCEGT47_033550 [Sorangium cellulosum]